MRRRNLITLLGGASMRCSIAAAAFMVSGISAFVQAQDGGAPAAARHPGVIVSFAVGPDRALTYPADLFTLADQHTTFLPPASGTGAYLVFASSSRTGGPAGAVALQTHDLKSFGYAGNYNSPVMVPATARFLVCRPGYNEAFDENYSAPGSVLQDPTRPGGHLIMLYEAENHCPNGRFQWTFYATIGFARSVDFGKTWPAPFNNSLGGADRRPVLRIAMPPPAASFPKALGDVSPSAFVDTNAKGEHLIYVAYIYVGPGADGYLRVARAKLDDDDPKSNAPDRRAVFTKWYKGAFSEPGIGGQDSGVTAERGCRGFQTHGQISYAEVIDQYLLTFVCVSLQGESGHMKAYQAAWYYATATSLELQNWSLPRLIVNSEHTATPACAPNHTDGIAFDGWYPSFMSPDRPVGHLAASGEVFFLDGCDGNALGRHFLSRSFTIKAE